MINTLDQDKMLLDLLQNKNSEKNNEYDQSIYKIKLNSPEFRISYEITKI